METGKRSVGTVERTSASKKGGKAGETRSAGDWLTPEVGIYKWKQESKTTRKHACFRPRKRSRKKEKRKKTRFRPRKWPRKKEKTFFFYCLFSWSTAGFLSFFLTFLFSFINSHLSVAEERGLFTPEAARLPIWLVLGC